MECKNGDLHRLLKNCAGEPMDSFISNIMESARPETLPEVPGKIRWKARFLGKHIIKMYYQEYYERESVRRIPFYLPYLFMQEHFDYLRRYGKIPRHQISMVLIDGLDERIDYFLFEFLEKLNYLTIVTERKEYFEGLQERAFQELGLLIDLVRPWEEKNLQGNMVWDFTSQLQRGDCYPEGSICFMPHKKEWKIREQFSECRDVTVVTVKNVEIKEQCMLPTLAETMLVPKNFPFRKSRLEELRRWCKNEKWKVKLKARTLEKP